MANVVPNVAKGWIGYYGSLPNSPDDAMWAVLLQAAGIESDDALKDYDTLADILAGSNDEATFTGYARMQLSGVTLTRDDSANEQRVTATNPSSMTNTGVSSQTMAKAVICYDPDTGVLGDGTLVPLAIIDFPETYEVGVPRTFSFATNGYVAAT